MLQKACHTHINPQWLNSQQVPTATKKKNEAALYSEFIYVCLDIGNILQDLWFFFFFFFNSKVSAGEMAQWLNNFLWKSENLSSNP